MQISVAMCTYNGSRFLGEQLESFAMQTLPPSELVVCDDGSSDSTMEILEDFAKTACFPVRIFRNEVNLGYAKNFEQAIRLCEGDFIALSDQDDIWYPKKLAVLTSFLSTGGRPGGVFSDGDIIDQNSKAARGSLWSHFRFDRGEQRKFTSGKALEVLLRRNVVTGMTLAFRAELREELLPIPATWEHDAWIAIMLVLNSKLTPSPSHLVQYRVHAGQQLGVPQSLAKKLSWTVSQGLPAYLDQVRTRNLDQYQRMANRFDDLVIRLSGKKGSIHREELAQIEAKSRHSHAALAALQDKKRARFRRVLSQASGYRLYSVSGLRAMVRDLLL